MSDAMRMSLLTGCVLVFAAAILADDKSAVTIEFDSKASKTGRFEVRGLTAAQLRRIASSADSTGNWTSTFSVTTTTKPATTAPAMLGDYVIADNVLRFEPRFPLQPGLSYTATFRGLQSDGPLVREFRIPAKDPAPPTVVTQVYPTRIILPENQLKFYLHFSAPMTQGDSYRFIRLLDGTGKPI